MRGRGFLVKGAALLLAGVLLAGCGGKTQEPESVSISEDSGLQKALKEGMGTSGNLSESVSESVKESEEDWSTKYDHYFEEHPVMNTIMEIDTEDQGNKIFLRFSFGMTDELLYVKYVVWECDAKKELDTSEERDYITAYFTKDGDVYLETVMKGKKTEYLKATGIDFNNAEEISQTDKPMGLGEDAFQDVKYVGEETIDGVLYDVLYTKSIRQTKSKANRWVKNYFYVNRETQELELYRLKDANEVMNIHFYPLDMDAIPPVTDAMKAGKKIKAEEVASRFAIAIVKITFHSMGMDPDQYNLEALMGLK